MEQSNARNATLKLTGTLGTNRKPCANSIEKVYNVVDGTDHAGYTLTLKLHLEQVFFEGNCYVLYADEMLKRQMNTENGKQSCIRNYSSRCKIICGYNRWSVTATLRITSSW